MNITGLDLVCAITRRCHFFALAVGFVNPSSQFASLIGHAQHRTHTHPELARNAAALREQYAELLTAPGDQEAHKFQNYARK
jgi:hypothetical protein